MYVHMLDRSAYKCGFCTYKINICVYMYKYMHLILTLEYKHVQCVSVIDSEIDITKYCLYYNEIDSTPSEFKY